MITNWSCIPQEWALQMRQVLVQGLLDSKTPPPPLILGVDILCQELI